MPKPVYCDSDDGEQAEWLVTNIKEGQSIALCGKDMTDFCTVILGHEPTHQSFTQPGVRAEEPSTFQEYDAPQGTQIRESITADDNSGDQGIQLRSQMQNQGPVEASAGELGQGSTDSANDQSRNVRARKTR